MKTDSLNSRLDVLEKQANPVNIRLIWYDDPDYGKQPEPGNTRINLHFLDELEGVL